MKRGGELHCQVWVLPHHPLAIFPGLGGMCGGFAPSSHEGESVGFNYFNQYCMD